MNKKERSARAVSQVEELLQCPICQEAMTVVDVKSLICNNQHTFDFAKQGYLNLLGRQSNDQYDKKLFDARQQIITETVLYGSLHTEVVKVIRKYQGLKDEPLVILDAGSGEGSHLQKMLDERVGEQTVAIGLDIAKEGIVKAAKEYIEPIWLVGDLANIPLADASVDVIFNMLSPANYEEFNRILADDGMIVKIIPRAHYLTELREVMFADRPQKTYSNEDTLALFHKHFELLESIPFQHQQSLSEAAMLNLLHMSPLGWNANEAQIDAFLQRDSSMITIDVELLIGKKKAL